jgi:hypothetical protein
VELRSHPLMTYRSGNNWPPEWTWVSGERKNLGLSGEIGKLVDVTPSKLDPHGKCFLTIEHEGTSYVGCLLFDDGPFCQQISRLLQRYVRYPLEYIGGIDLPRPVENQRPSTERRSSLRRAQSVRNS